MKIIGVFAVLVATVFTVLVPSYLPQIMEIPQGPGLWGLLILLSLATALMTKGSMGIYPLGNLAVTIWLLALVLTGIQVLGGLNQPQNILPLVAWAILQGALANPIHSLFCLFLLLLATALQVGNQIYGFLPYALASVESNLPGFLWNRISPVFLSSLISLILMGSRRFVQVSVPQPPPSQPPKPKERHRPSGSVAAVNEGNDSEAALEAARSSSFLAVASEEDPRASQFFSRSYLENLGAKAMKDKQDTLEEVVFFMSRNFKAYTSIGFLLDPLSNKLMVNAVVTKSQKFNYECLIEMDQGIIGASISKPAGFITGNLKSYPGELEYYNERESIHSIMAMRVMDKQNKRMLGMLVVDSETQRAFTDEHKTLMDRFTRIASSMITNANMSIQMNRFALQAENQYEVAKSLASALRWEDVLEAMVESLKRTFEHDRILLCGYNAQSGKGYLWKIFGRMDDLTEGMEFNVQEPQSLFGSVFRNRRPIVVEGFHREEKFGRFSGAEDKSKGPKDLLIAPIQDDRQSTMGIVAVEMDREGAYSQVELQLMKTIMANVSNALTKARMYQEMENQATIDGLTQIPNHRKFQDFFNVELDRCQRYQLPLSLLLMDIDHFKKFNDTYGHPIGDKVLQTVAKTITQSIRTSDFCARYGGEEFVVILVQADEEHAAQLAERIREAIERMVVPMDSHALQVTVSIGSSTFPADGITKQEIIDNADKAMYQSKHAGRNRVTPFGSIPKDALATKVKV